MPGADHEQLVRELAAAYGVSTDYWDWQGRHVVVETTTMVAVLAALDVHAGTEERAREALAIQQDAAWARMLPPVLVTRQGWQPTFDVHVPDGSPVDVWIELETGEHRGGVEQRENWNPPLENAWPAGSKTSAPRCPAPMQCRGPSRSPIATGPNRTTTSSR